MKFWLSKFAYLPIILLFIIFFVVWVYFGFLLVLLILIVFAIFLYRKKHNKIICDDDKAILAPIAGKISNIDNIEHNELGECLQIIIQNSILDEGVIYANSNMNIENIRIRHGFFGFKKLSNLSERVFITAKNNNIKFAMRIIIGSLSRRVKLCKNLKNLKVGDEMGFSINSTIVLLLPKNTRLLINTGDKVKSCDLLGYFE